MNAACGGSAKEAPAPAAASSRPPPAASAEPVAAVRIPSADLRRHWPFGNDFEFGAYLETARDADADLVSMLRPVALSAARQYLPEAQRECVTEMMAAVRELAVGAKEAAHLFVLGLDFSVVKSDPVACIRGFFGGEPANIPGVDASFVKGSEVIVLKTGLLIAGERTTIQRALAANTGEAWPERLHLSDHQRLKVIVRLPQDMTSAEGFVASSAEFLRIEVKASFPDEASAVLVERQVDNGMQEITIKLARGLLPQTAQRIIAGLRVTRDGRVLALGLDLDEPVLEQARDFGIVSALMVYGVRKYVLNAKIAEARETVAAIAKSEVEAWGHAPLAERRLVSLPPVPAEVPHGEKYKSAPRDWKAWAPLHFSLDHPQYFQYKVVAAKDGKHADVIGQGDLDGNGKTSLFKLTLSVEPKDGSLQVSPRIEEQDPEE